MPTTTDGTGTLGPGVLTIGETGTELDVSCLVNNASIVPDISEGDEKTMLCGTSKRSADTITWALSGNVDVDAGLSSGLFALSWNNIGDVVPFEFTPSTAVGTTVTGNLKIAPLELGADNYGDYLNSDFESGLDNFDPKTAVTYGGTAAVSITGVTAGSPGSFVPSNATKPSNLAALKGHGVVGDAGSNKPVAAWTTGQSVKLADASDAHWDGTAWASGVVA